MPWIAIVSFLIVKELSTAFRFQAPKQCLTFEHHSCLLAPLLLSIYVAVRLQWGTRIHTSYFSKEILIQRIANQVLESWKGKKDTLRYHESSSSMKQ